MCAVSMVVHGIGQEFPNFPSGWPLQQLTDLKLILDRLDSIDKKMKAKDCLEEEKDEFFKKLEKRIAALEKRRTKKKKVPA